MKKGQSKFNWENSIPLILIILLAIFLAAKFGVIDLSTIPVVGGWFPQSSIRVGIVGQGSPGLIADLQSSDSVGRGITTYPNIDPQTAQYTLQNFQIIILQGTPYCSLGLRFALANWVRNGGKLIVIGDACTQVPNDPTSIGWNVGVNSLGSVMPATYGGLTTSMIYTPTSYTQGYFTDLNPSSQIFGGSGGVEAPGTKNFAFSGYVTPVFPTATNSQVDAVVNTGVGGSTQYAIIETQGLLQLGKVIYFSFDPGTTAGPTLVYQTILYLAHASG
jgi:hypothetical protein